MVNDSNAQGVLERDPQTQITNTEMSDRTQNQSSGQALMASIRARRYFIGSTDLSSDMNPDLAAVIEDTLAQMAQALNNDEEPSVTHSDNKEYFDETSVYEDSYTLEHWPDDTEYMVPSSKNTKLQWSTSESDKSEFNMTQMILTWFYSEIMYDRDSDEFRYIPTRNHVRLWDDRNIIYHEVSRKCYQFHNATNNLIIANVEHCPMETRFLLCKDKVLRPNQKWTNGNKTKVSDTQFN